MSEAAQGIVDNLAIVKNSTIFSETLQEQLDDDIAPLRNALQRLNLNDKTTQPTTEDIHELRTFALSGDNDQDNWLAHVTQASSALYVLSVQLRAIRAVMIHTEDYAGKLQCDDPSAVAFKTAKSVPAMQQMLIQF